MPRMRQVWITKAGPLPFSEAPAAHRFLHERKATGKVLLTP